MATKQKFATQVDAELLAVTRQIAESEGRELQSIVEEALLDWVEKRRQVGPRANVLAHYEASLAQFGSLYERLAC